MIINKSHYLSVFYLAVAILFSPPGPGIYAESKSKHDRILQSRQAKDILSFKQVMDIVIEKTNGEIIEAEFEYDDGIPVYEFKYISVSGRVREIYIDARNGKIIKDKLD